MAGGFEHKGRDGTDHAMSERQIHDFGLVDDKGDAFEFVIDATGTGTCYLVAVVQTERGPRRTEVAGVPSRVWNAVATAAAKELAAEMGEGEREKKTPTFCAGFNRLSPLVGRELGVLLIVLMEEDAEERKDALLHAWRELAREERWWLYSKAAAPRQQPGAGWRRALFHALSETSETRSAPTEETQKKNLWEHREELVAETGFEGYSKEARTGNSTTSTITSTAAQEKTKRPRGKDKCKKPSKRNPQIKLF
jgi:hypothetical protein